MNKLLLQYFGIEAQNIKKLAGYDNVNYLVTAKDAKYIFKTYVYDDLLFDIVKAESDVLLHLQKPGTSCFPKVIKTVEGKNAAVSELEGRKIIIRLLSYLEGQFFAEATHSPQLFKSFGEFLAHMDLRLMDYKNYTIQARRYSWDLTHLQLNKPFLEDIELPSDRKIARYFMMQFEEVVRPKLPELRNSIIHNDANDWNVLVTEGKVSAIIDFGDIVYTPLINELAVALTYAIMGKEDPVSWACHIISSYHNIITLQQQEVDLLYYLIAAQLCISVCNSAQNKKADPDNEYIAISEKPAWELLRKWISINPLNATNKFRGACGMAIDQQEKLESKIKRRHQFVDPLVSLSYSKPIFMKRAAFQYMYDGYGNTFLDAYNNIPHVGHVHPDVVAAGQREMAILNTNTRYVYDQLNEYAERLLAKFPEALNKVYFVNSGSEANELAIRLAKHHTGSNNVMVMEHGYHGNTNMAIDISDYKFSNERGPGQKSYILKAALPDIYRGMHHGQDAGRKYAEHAIDVLEKFGDQVAAFISEPIVGCGGQVPLPTEYLKTLYPAIRKQGGVCISDEVQTGFGRLGTHVWGFETQDVVPDIVVLGKPMGNGHPIGAVVTTSEIADSFNSGVEFFSSFGGNPVSCAIGLEVLNVIEREGLQQNALEVGNYYMGLMSEVSKEFDCIGDVRGSGLFLGFEIIKGNKEHNTILAAKIKNELRNRHILVSTDGPYNNVIKSKPPLCFSKENAALVVEEIHNILKEE